MDAAALEASGINLNLTSSERAAIVQEIDHTGLITYEQFKAGFPTKSFESQSNIA